MAVGRVTRREEKVGEGRYGAREGILIEVREGSMVIRVRQHNVAALDWYLGCRLLPWDGIWVGKLVK
jgi:hypothetical protein